MAPIILVSPLLVDLVPADGSPILLISVSLPLLGPEPALVLVALLVPDSVPPFLVLGSILVPLALLVPDLVPPPLLVSVAELDWDSSASKSHEGSLSILAYCQAYVLGRS